MFVVMGTTRGDDLIPSTRKALFTSASATECQMKIEQLAKEQNDWLATHVPHYMQLCAIVIKFEIVEEKHDKSEEPKEIDWFAQNRS